MKTEINIKKLIGTLVMVGDNINATEIEEKVLNALTNAINAAGPKELENLRYHKDTSVGLWCIDRNPKEVSKEWINENAFQLTYDDSDNVL
ncbi:MAG: hypothetical protein LBN95_09830 [Prevotellaceae bacterium]|jgi:hypothetical protein|nr:hypothetical protein [Prevotellaceae bacterium]